MLEESKNDKETLSKAFAAFPQNIREFMIDVYAEDEKVLSNGEIQALVSYFKNYLADCFVSQQENEQALSTIKTAISQEYITQAKSNEFISIKPYYRNNSYELLMLNGIIKTKNNSLIFDQVINEKNLAWYIQSVEVKKNILLENIKDVLAKGSESLINSLYDMTIKNKNILYFYIENSSDNKQEVIADLLNNPRFSFENKENFIQNHFFSLIKNDGNLADLLNQLEPDSPFKQVIERQNFLIKIFSDTESKPKGKENKAGLVNTNRINLNISSTSNLSGRKRGANEENLISFRFSKHSSGSSRLFKPQKVSKEQEIGVIKGKQSELLSVEHKTNVCQPLFKN